MAFDKTPSVWMGSWAEDAVDITVPLATFTELTAAEADGATGDIRKIIFAYLEHWYQYYNALATADRPSKMTLAKSASINTVTNVQTNTYTITIQTGVLTQEVVAE